MRRMLLLVAVVFVFVAGAYAQELVTLTTPFTPPTVSVCRVSVVKLDLDNATVSANLTCPNGQPITKTYDSGTVPTGATLLHSLNTGNFSVNSLVKAVYNRLITDGVITGVVSGVPQD